MFRIMIYFILLIFSLNLFAGEKIVFLKESPNGAKLALVDTKTKKENIINVGSYKVIYPTISADGKLIAFSGSINERDWGIYIYEISSNKISEVVAPNGLTIQPSFSGNGKYLAFTAPVVSSEGKKNQIHILNFKKWKVDKKVNAEVISTKLAAFYPYLSAAGFKVAFHLSQKLSGKRFQSIAMYDLENQKLYEFKDQNGNLLEGKAPCFNLDDSKLAFVTHTGNDNWSIREFDIDAQKLTNITSGEYKDYSPRYLTGNKLMFSSNRTGEFKFYVLKLSATNQEDNYPQVLYQSIGNIWDPRVSGNLNYQQKLKASMAGEKRSSFGAVTVGDSIYVVAGHKGFEHTYPPESFSKEVYRYDLKTNKWTRLADKINAVHGVTIAHYNGFIYAFGGFSYASEFQPKWKSLRAIERYDIANDKWEIVGELPEPRSSNAIAVFDNKAYLIGGWDATPKFAGDKDGTFHKSIVIFDMKNETAKYAAFEVPKKARRAFTATTIDKKIIIGGGITQGGRHFDMLDEVWSIDPTRDLNWKRLPGFPFGNFAPAILNVKGTIFMFGGMKLTKNGYGYINHIYILDDSTKKWIHTGRYLSERKGFIQPVLIDGMAALLGGHTYDYIGKDGPVSTFEVFKSIKR